MTAPPRNQLSTFWHWARHHLWVAALLVVIGFGLQAFYELAEDLLEGTLLAFDLRIFQLLRPYQSRGLDHLAILLSLLMLWPYVGLVFLPWVILLVRTRRWRLLAGLLVIPLFTALLVTLLKAIFTRPRPTTGLFPVAGFSFPSGHATDGMVIYGLLAYITCRYWVRTRRARALTILLAALLILGTGLARVYLHVHYCTDVLAGWSAGACLLAGSIIALECWAGEPRTQGE